MTQLSICIPTYNRSDCLAHLLESIVDQDDYRIEIVVFDDASTDGTPSFMKAYSQRHPRLRYLRHDQNVGLDKNFLSVVASATSPYVWLMGDDDRLEPGAIERVLKMLDRNPDAVGATLGVLDYSADFGKLTGVRWMPSSQTLTGAPKVFQSIPELLGFMSAMVIRRESWNSAIEMKDLSHFHNLYLQLYIAGCAIGTSGKWVLLNEPCVGFRSDNDQFLGRMGWLERTLVDATAYESIGKALFPSDQKTRALMRERIFRSHIRARLRNGKLGGLGLRTTMTAISKLFPIYKGVPGFWLEGLPTLAAPSWTLKVAKWFYQRLWSASGLVRARRMSA